MIIHVLQAVQEFVVRKKGTAFPKSSIVEGNHMDSHIYKFSNLVARIRKI